ncbi:hypothetical protein [Paeniglutamicibacter sp.]|uniref:hypothetical protein n=1 Tax=Paeniglutamicibacter sp. TaxID=1934391 RepID=UPI003989958C
MPVSPVLKARSDLGVATRRKDAAAVAQARQELAAAKILAYAARTVADAPPLTSEQRALIAAALGGA